MGIPVVTQHHTLHYSMNSDGGLQQRLVVTGQSTPTSGIMSPVTTSRPQQSKSSPLTPTSTPSTTATTFSPHHAQHSYVSRLMDTTSLLTAHQQVNGQLVFLFLLSFYLVFLLFVDQYVSSLHHMTSCKQPEGSGSSPVSPKTPTMILPPPPPLLPPTHPLPPPILSPHQHDLYSPSTAASLASLLLHHHHPAALTGGYPAPWTTFSWMAAAAAAAAATYAYGGNPPPPTAPMDLSTAFQQRNSLSIADLRLKAKRHADELDVVSTSPGVSSFGDRVLSGDQPWFFFSFFFSFRIYPRSFSQSFCVLRAVSLSPTYLSIANVFTTIKSKSLALVPPKLFLHLS